jgi:hypothetical protein
MRHERGGKDKSLSAVIIDESIHVGTVHLGRALVEKNHKRATQALGVLAIGATLIVKEQVEKRKQNR